MPDFSKNIVTMIDLIVDDRQLGLPGVKKVGNN